ncbi:YqhG family protein [Oceanobacillus halotolerans]|uniref:YqhG family protein n=1 Tax=Oceanobacillus halotolerans TaxID=2663380 RepID=UPI0013DB0F42|nr:YqhG family protein [Oceanobacillus halotolerans]
MAIKDLKQFLETYFTAHHCTINEKEDGVFTVQLTEELDRALMNRPFYWHYVKKMGRPGQPMELTFITNPEKREQKGEWIHFGSPRLQQIMNHLKNNECFTQLFQKVETTERTALFPWLVLNVKISYKGKQKKDEIISIGLHLVNGTMKLEMMDILRDLPLQNTISNFCYTISPIIKVRSGFYRVEAVLEDYLQNQDQEWADESQKKLDEEVDLLKHFYVDRTDLEDPEDQMKREIDDIKKRYEPTVTMQVINGGIFYLADNTMN